MAPRVGNSLSQRSLPHSCAFCSPLPGPDLHALWVDTIMSSIECELCSVQWETAEKVQDWRQLHTLSQGDQQSLLA